MKNALSPVIKNNIKTQAPDVIYIIKNIKCIPLPNIFDMKKNIQRQVPVHQNYKKKQADDSSLTVIVGNLRPCDVDHGFPMMSYYRIFSKLLINH